jgi:hypothetical protein
VSLAGLRPSTNLGSQRPPTSSLGDAGVLSRASPHQRIRRMQRVPVGRPPDRSQVDGQHSAWGSILTALTEVGDRRSTGPKFASWRLEPEGPWATTRHAAGERRCLPWGSFPFGGISSGDLVPDCLPDTIRSQRFSRSQRLDPTWALWPCFMPHPPLGFRSSEP